MTTVSMLTEKDQSQEMVSLPALCTVSLLMI